MKHRITDPTGTQLVVRTTAGTYEGALAGNVTEVEMVPYYSPVDRAYGDYYERARMAVDMARSAMGGSMPSYLREMASVPPPPPMPQLFQRTVPVLLLLRGDDDVINQIAYEHIVMVKHRPTNHAEAPS